MLYMVVEHFKNRDAKAVYSRFREKGRMMPEGLHYIASWTEANFERCFQVMETDDPALFEEWLQHWRDLGDYEVVPVMTSAQAVEAAFAPEATSDKGTSQ